MPLNMAPPLRESCPAVLGPNHSSNMYSFVPSVASMRWFNSSLKEREYGLLRQAGESGFTDPYFNPIFAMMDTLTGMAQTGFISFPVGQFRQLTAPNAVNATSDMPATHVARFARARIKAVAHAQAVVLPLPVAALPPLPDDPVVPALVHCIWLVAVWCACAVILDFAMAVLGAMLRIAMAPPMIYMHAITCTMNMCMRIMSVPYCICDPFLHHYAPHFAHTYE